MLLPSIDLMGGRAVQLRQGRERVLGRDDVFELLADFARYGEVAVVDLDAAMGQGSNRELIERMLATGAPVRVGGGIRDRETAVGYLKAGARRVVLGTACREAWVDTLPRERLVFALDARGDDWLSHGWTHTTGQSVADVLGPLGARCGQILYTQVETEGMMEGLDRARVEAVVAASPVPVAVAGGVTTADDVAWLHRLGADVQIGMAVYTGALSLADALVACVDFEKGGGLVPTVVQDADRGTVLMLAYSTEATLRQALADARGVYHSRSRGGTWVKGETSGHTQSLVAADVDCDGDTLLFRVRQAGPACHTGRASCFGTQGGGFALADLDRTLAARAAAREGYTGRLLADAALRAAKIREEAEEVIEATATADIRWEAADVLYHTLVHARAAGVTLADIEAELGARVRRKEK